MADTERTLAALQSLLADNTSGEISAQDVRDMLVSLVAPRASLYIASGDTAETSIASSGTWTKLAGVTTLGANETTRAFTMPQNNRLTYTGTVERDMMVACSISAQSAGNNADFEFALAKNGTVLPSTEVDQFFKTSTEKENVGFTDIVNLTEDDYVEVFVRNQTDATNITADTLQLAAFGFLD